jgi:hypothetical protein
MLRRAAKPSHHGQPLSSNVRHHIMQVVHLETWRDLKESVADLREAATTRRQAQVKGYVSQLLYRGQANAEWKLNTSLDRARSEPVLLEKYYSALWAALPVVESFTGRSFPTLDILEVSRELAQPDGPFFPKPPPAYEVLVHFRHHGFPSPLLDWSRSFQIAAFFAFESPQADRIAFFAYQEHTGTGKGRSVDEPCIISLGPRVRSHPRHVLQQAEYTLAVRHTGKTWAIAPHEDVFDQGSTSQDRLWKFTVPSSEASKVLAELDEVNINAYSLFQTEDALMKTLAFRTLRMSDRADG